MSLQCDNLSGELQDQWSSSVILLQDAEYTTSIYIRQFGTNVEPYQYLGRYRAHYKPIKEIIFGTQLDDDSPRLMTLGQDRVLVRFS